MHKVRKGLTIDASADGHVCAIDYDYPKFRLSMHCCLCHVIAGKIKLLDYHELLGRSTFDQVEWLPADLGVIKAIKVQGIVQG